MKPIKTNDNYKGVVYRHPAFGILKMSVTQSGGKGATLFGSNLNHNTYMHFQLQIGEESRINEAEIRYSKSYDREVKPIIADFSMSMNQFVNLITTPNVGEGIPCTLNYYNTGSLFRAPPIDTSEVENLTSRIKQDVRDAAKAESAKFEELLSAVDELVAKGKAGKKDLADIRKSLSNLVGNLPSNLAFSVTLAEEAVDKMVTVGKGEIEATLMNSLKQLGIESIQEGKPLTKALPNKDAE